MQNFNFVVLLQVLAMRKFRVLQKKKIRLWRVKKFLTAKGRFLWLGKIVWLQNLKIGRTQEVVVLVNDHVLPKEENVRDLGIVNILADDQEITLRVDADHVLENGNVPTVAADLVIGGDL